MSHFELPHCKTKTSLRSEQCDKRISTLMEYVPEFVVEVHEVFEQSQKLGVTKAVLIPIDDVTDHVNIQAYVLHGLMLWYAAALDVPVVVASSKRPAGLTNHIYY